MVLVQVFLVVSRSSAELGYFSSLSAILPPQFCSPLLSEKDSQRLPGDPTVQKSVEPSLLNKGCPAGADPANPGWLWRWVAPTTIKTVLPCRDKHMG